MLETGILAEMDGKPNPELFIKALKAYEQMDEGIVKLIAVQKQLISIDKEQRSNLSKDNKVRGEYDLALSNILKEMGKVERLSKHGTRYTTIAGLDKTENNQLVSMPQILEAQLEDMLILDRMSSVAVDSLRGAIPLAERSEFVDVMLSGRNAFGDIMPQFTDMISAFDRFYVRSCMSTIAATMQTYPLGWKWLQKQKK